MQRYSSMAVMWWFVAALLFSGAASGQTRQDFIQIQGLVQQLRAEIQLLRSEVDQLHQQVKSLEASLHATGAIAPASAPEVQLLMYLEEMSFTQGAEERSPEISKLKAEAAELHEKTMSTREEANRLEKFPWWGSWRYTYAPSWWDRDRDRRDAVELEVKRKRRRLKNEALEYEKQAQKKLGNAIRLERKAADSVQLLLYGWDGEKSVILEADRDLRHALDGNTSGVFITWRGRPVGSSLEEGDSWEIKSIELVHEPLEFKYRGEEEVEEEEADEP